MKKVIVLLVVVLAAVTAAAWASKNAGATVVPSRASYYTTSAEVESWLVDDPYVLNTYVDDVICDGRGKPHLDATGNRTYRSFACDLYSDFTGYLETLDVRVLGDQRYQFIPTG